MPILAPNPGNASSIAEFPDTLPSKAYLGDSGIVLANGNVVDDYGCAWRWSPTNAWGNKPGPREQTVDKAFDHGQVDSTKYTGPRTLSIPGAVTVPSHGSLHLAEQRLRDAVTVEPFMLRITEPGFDSWAMARQSGEVLWSEVNRTTAKFNIGLYLANPRIWSSFERFTTLTFPDISGGLAWPATWPATWATTGTDGSKQLTNPGRGAAPMVFTIMGPVGEMSIALPELAVGLNLANPEGPLLGAGDVLKVDTGSRRVLLNGTANRRSWAFGTFLKLPPQATTKVAIVGSGTTSASKVDVTYRAHRI